MDISENILVIVIILFCFAGMIGGLDKILYGMSDPQNSVAAGQVVKRGCGIFVLFALIQIWAIVSIIIQDWLFI